MEISGSIAVWLTITKCNTKYAIVPLIVQTVDRKLLNYTKVSINKCPNEVFSIYFRSVQKYKCKLLTSPFKLYKNKYE